MIEWSFTKLLAVQLETHCVTAACAIHNCLVSPIMDDTLRVLFLKFLPLQCFIHSKEQTSYTVAIASPVQRTAGTCSVFRPLPSTNLLIGGANPHETRTGYKNQSISGMFWQGILQTFEASLWIWYHGWGEFIQVSLRDTKVMQDSSWCGAVPGVDWPRWGDCEMAWLTL